MELFYFHVSGGEPVEAQLNSLAEAKCEAVRYAGQLICDAASDFWDVGDMRVTVSDEKGLLLFILQFSAVESPAIRAQRRA